MDKYQFRVGNGLIFEVKAKSIPAAWFRVTQKYSQIIANYGYLEYVGIRRNNGQ